MEDTPEDEIETIPLHALEDIPLQDTQDTFTDASTISTVNKNPSSDIPTIATDTTNEIFPSLGGRKKIDKLRNNNATSLSIYKNPKKRNINDRLENNQDFTIETRKYSRDNKEYDATLPKPQKRRLNYLKAVKHVMQTKHVNPSLNYFDAIVHNNSKVESKQFKDAYDKEITQLLKMNTWDNDNLYDAKDIPKKQIINSMFIFTTKRDGARKCRFVARGDQQHPST